MSRNQNGGEVYRMEIVEKGFLFKISEALYQHFLSKVTNKRYLELLSETPKTTIGGVAILHINLPFVDFSKGTEGGIDWEGLATNAQQLEILFSLVACLFPDDAESTDSYCLSKDVQLMTMSTSYRADNHFHSCGMSVEFSDRAYGLLRNQYTKDTIIPRCEEKIVDFYFGLSADSQAELDEQKQEYLGAGGGGPFGVRGMVREQGVPAFTVPGNCACLGANPDDFKYSKDLHSHNLDTPLQQMSMLAGLVTFWNEVLIPLHEEKK